MKVSENTSVSMPIKNMIGIVIAVAMGIFAYTEITARLTSLETSRELMLNDLLKASDQKPIDQEQFLIQESLASDLEKLITSKLMGNLCSKPRAFAIGTSIFGLLIWAMVDPSIYVTIE